ncbi:MAG TPA: D-glycero-beta-D-manno-heptose 1-phosphate adenylyltransferase [Chthonomonadales bacterium]|nr:D-glycero-beta-D-manno-heptose 1-phosphate adenylyltransferase [Chthonomonadales bacterium]
MRERGRAASEKVVSREDLGRAVAGARAGGRRIVFTNGCFDILHIGHVRYLADARALGDLLVVGLNSDASVRRLKGERRPLVPQDERAEMLAHLASVDLVCIFEEDRPDDLIRIVRPDVHAKGGDYRADELPEAPLVRSLGGQVAIVPLVEGRSTTLIVNRIVSLYGAEG